MRLNTNLSVNQGKLTRGADKLIEQGRVKINGRVAKIGDK